MRLHTDTFNRLSLGIIEKDNCTPEEAYTKLSRMQINLVCGDEIAKSLPLQAALLTAINTAKRSFLGGTFVQLPADTPCLVHWPGKPSLNRIVLDLGGKLIDSTGPGIFSLIFGKTGNVDDDQMQVVCNNWQAGVCVNGEGSAFNLSGNIPTAGIFAGAFAVFLAFLKISGIHIAACDHTTGISLWRPDLDWLHTEAKGPLVTFLPRKYWTMGLGHLGQAYLWNICLLPYEIPGDVTLMLQDDDRIVEANWSAGLLSELSDAHLLKTRLCSRWLERRGFKTLISERRFDAHTRRASDEPFVALCGFDSGASRIPLEKAGFDLVIESGLGGNLATFDMISQHTFPGGLQTPEQLWGELDETKLEINEAVYRILESVSEGEDCGIIPIALAGKSLSASFVGACSGALGIAELLRGLHGGLRYDKVSLQLRNLGSRQAVPHSKGPYLLEHSRNGFVFAENASGL